jgi:SAM-dependent methyltransferase
MADPMRHAVTMPPSRDLLARIHRLRELFLDEERGSRPLADYWRNEADVAAYDRVLGARIGWKWDAALAECRDRGLPRADDQVVLDFGCGSGIAARRFVHWFGAREVLCHDRSRTAATFAAKSVRAQFAGTLAKAIGSVDDVRPDVLLVSHVLGELDAAGEVDLHGLIERCRRIVIVEPGSRTISRRLSNLRDGLLGSFHIVAPCPHATSCPALAMPNDWCHFFAAPAPEAFTDSDWVLTARALGIDSRALPYSFLALSREPIAAAMPTQRVLGRPDQGKHTARVLVCEPGGLRAAAVHKRSEPALWKLLRKHPESVRTLEG